MVIAGLFHQGSGIGNMLFRFVGTKVLALDRGMEHAMVATELFKGSSFMTLDVKDAGLEYMVEYPAGKTVVKDLKGITVVDSEFQSELNFMHRLDEVRDWLKVEPMEVSDDLCIISHRGGEYRAVPDLYLPQTYWDLAIKMTREKYPKIQFQVQTDDIVSAREQFPDFSCIHDVGHNWRSIRFAKHLIVGNSSFSILPSLLGFATEIIAPKYHAGYLKGYWQAPENLYSRYTYI